MAQAGARGENVFAVTVHVVGAGVAGLAAACTLAEAGERVVLHEAAKAAGGRCRSYFDPALECRIDNGNHLLLSGNLSTMAYLKRVGAEGSLTGPAAPDFPFVDLASGAHWTLRINPGRLPWWIFSPARRVPGTQAKNYLALLQLRRARSEDLVAPLVGHCGALYERLLAPLAIAALNTMPEVASAAPLRAVVAETIERGGAHCVPRWPAVGLSESFIDPALAFLEAKGADIRLSSRVAALVPGQKTVLAVPPWIARELLPNLTVPDAFEAIANLHFVHEMPPGPAGFWGVIGGTAEWVFAKGNITSVTISAANRVAEVPNEVLAELVWADLVRAFGVPADMPVFRVVREKRATFAATPAQLARRPGTRNADKNVFLAGDWTDTGLPATIEGAIRSGNRAALALLG
jgi:squalene-associated FAD-dependent desaturase